MSRYVAMAALVLLTSLAASSALAPAHLLRPASRAGTAQLYAVGVRGSKSVVSSKLDGVLSDLNRHASGVRPGHALADLHALSPAAHFGRSAPGAAPMVAIDATTRGDPQALESALISLGLKQPALYRNDVGGFLPVSQLDAAAARSEVSSIRAAMPHRHATGAVATQGDYAQASSVVRSDFPNLTGQGITVGVFSDSFDCYSVYAAPGSGVPASGYQGYAYNGFTADYATDVSTGALPSNVTVVEEPTYSGYSACFGYQDPDSENQPTGLPFSDEGRAMLQVVYAVAPGASLVFRTGAISEADFASGIEALAAAPYNAKVEADDLGYYDEPFFQDGILAQAIDTVESEGVSYFSAAGNDQETPSYYNTAPTFGTLSSSSPNSGEYLLNFDTTGATTTTSLPVTIPPLQPGDFVAVVLQWDQPYVTGSPDSGGATSQLDLCITGSTGQDVVLNYDNDVVSCSGPNTQGSDPYQVMIIANPSNATGNTAQVNINIQVGLANGTVAPGKVIVAVEDDGQGSTINKFSPNGPSLQGHPGAAGAAAVGAAFYFDTPRCGTTPATLEPYSNAGGLPILFSTSGTRLGTPTVRQKPDFVGPDGINTTFLGFTLASDSPPYPASGVLNTTISECQNNTAYPNFFGTSAATPHAAAIAALMLQANAALTPSDVYAALQASAVPMPVSNSISSCTTADPNYCSGYGFIQAASAMVTPALSASATSIAPGGAVTLTWVTANASSCSASGGWSGTLAASGSQSVTAASTAGNETFTLTCTDSAGDATGSNSVTLDVQPAPSAPTLTLASSSIQAGSSTTITWASTNASSCTASGSWSGTLATSGTQTLTPSSAGTDTYSLTCSNAVGASPAASVTLTVTAASSGGGGALDVLSLFALMGLWGTAHARKVRGYEQESSP